ncbi:PilZ domain-containing protein [Desulfacinum hydrothermale DSM 13146]|uniref:PilZ domain-containing protein n=1 Tax=Desulfacinum hydrothermale DSM 13146 TaxID=1121390 RepID=A0A1W1X6K5_9BACT|nr:PilZ domain-containing protein [Desulfacinum hydrothermale]SMC19457.1 PilZ domain-containing protein [Desulfacinum hydrothermale DSM 13146]
MEESNHREYLRVRIPELTVFYNELAQDQEPPFFLGFGPGHDSASLQEKEAEDPFVREVMGALARLESKMDRLLGYLERQESREASYAHQGRVVDISGGGLSFVTVTLHSVGTYLEMCLLPQLGNPRPIYAVGKICWIEPAAESGDTAAHLVGVQFVEIDEADRESIIRVVFRLQRMWKEKAREGKDEERETREAPRPVPSCQGK